MQDENAEEPRDRVRPRRSYEKPVVIDEEVFERATLLGASGSCDGELGICGTPENPAARPR